MAAVRPSVTCLLPRGRLISSSAAIFVLAATVRLWLYLRGGGANSSFGYDSPVYFAAADSVMHGRLPYRDFMLIHPPGIALAISPFAALTHTVDDRTAFAAANIAFALLGAFNAVLVLRIGRRLGFGGAALIGAVVYALWYGSVEAEYLARLEPLGNALFLSGVLKLVPDRRGAVRSRRSLMTGGAAMGAAVSVKIWWSLPVLLVLAWCLWRKPAARRPTLAGLLLAVLLINGPFFLAAPHSMWTSVISDQLGRGRDASGSVVRLAELTGVPFRTSPTGLAAWIAIVVVGGLIALAAVRAARTPTGRPVAALFLVQVIVLLVAPSFFLFYRDYAAGSLALTLSASGTGLSSRRRLTPTLAFPLIAGLSTVFSVATDLGGPAPLHGTVQLEHILAGRRCVMSDSPMALIALDALSKNLANGCADWVDVTGRTYGPPDAPVPGAPTARSKNQRWIIDLIGYLRTGDAVILWRPGSDGLTPSTIAVIGRDGVLASIGGHTVYRVEHAKDTRSVAPVVRGMRMPRPQTP